MIILLKILYILFFACADVILYSLLHKKAWVTKNQIIIFCIIFIVAAVLHIGIIKINFLMPVYDFFRFALAPLLIISMMHFFGIYSIKRMNNPNNRASEDLKELILKFWSFFTFTMPYFFFFFGQCLWVISF
jgi:hypothetical protein